MLFINSKRGPQQKRQKKNPAFVQQIVRRFFALHPSDRLDFVYTGPPQITNTKSGENQLAIVFESVIHCWSFSLQHQLAGKIVNILALKSVRLSPLASINNIFRGSQDLYHLFPFMQRSVKIHGKVLLKNHLVLKNQFML